VNVSPVSESNAVRVQADKPGVELTGVPGESQTLLCDDRLIVVPSPHPSLHRRHRQTPLEPTKRNILWAHKMRENFGWMRRLSGFEALHITRPGPPTRRGALGQWCPFSP
jgi:hypothetical protein